MDRLSCSVDIPEALLDRAAKVIEARPDLIQQRTDRAYLTVELPSTWKRQMMQAATHGRLTISKGRIWEYSETWGSCSGGYIGSCMPPSIVAALLRLWLKFAEASKPIDIAQPVEQLELFA